MIEFQNVSKFYEPEIIALKDVTFKIDTGEFVFIVGPSGAGKSTIIRLIIRNELPTEGDIAFDDIDVIRLPRTLLPTYRLQIGVVFQDCKLLESKTVRENIQFALELTGEDDKEVKDTTDYLLDIVKLSDRADLFPMQLSGGEKQKAGIARALANDPKLLIADEPTGNLDPDTSVEIIGLLQKINTWGTTVLIATHDQPTVDALQKRVLRIEEGAVISDKKGSYNGENVLPKKKREKRLPKRPIEKGKISKLDLNKKIIKVLEGNNIKTIGDLLDQSETDLENIKGLNKKKVKNILAKLENLLKSK